MFSDSTFAGLQTEGQSSFMLKNVGRIMRIGMKFHTFEMHVYT